MRRPTVAVVLLVASVSCAHKLVQPGPPGSPSRAISRNDAVDLSAVRFTPADVKFMQGMIHHHAQALDLTALVDERTGREGMKLLAKRIEISQSDEIRLMQRWLEARRQEVPGLHDHHAPGAALMPGMLSPEQMDRVAAAKGAEFDRLWLEGMIRHHDGALAMVDELFSSPGAGQEPEIFSFTSDIVADQKAEIGRMAGILQELQNETEP